MEEAAYLLACLYGFIGFLGGFVVGRLKVKADHQREMEEFLKALQEYAKAKGKH